MVAFQPRSVELGSLHACRTMRIEPHAERLLLRNGACLSVKAIPPRRSLAAVPQAVVENFPPRVPEAF
jgi:hypothetical protein